jgi:hypothetical protein
LGQHLQRGFPDDPSGCGVESVRLSARSQNLNANAERFVRSIKESCLDRMMLIGESSLHRATSQFALHYHQERNPQGLENKIIQPELRHSRPRVDRRRETLRPSAAKTTRKNRNLVS